MKQETYQDLEPSYNPKAYLSDWVFHYNSDNKKWAAIPRESYTAYWNNYSHSSVLRSNSIETLLELLHKAHGDVVKIDKLTSGKK